MIVLIIDVDQQHFLNRLNVIHYFNICPTSEWTVQFRLLFPSSNVMT